MARPDLGPHVMSETAPTPATPAESPVTRINVVEHQDESDPLAAHETSQHWEMPSTEGDSEPEEPSATQSSGTPEAGSHVGTSFMDKMTEHEPTAGPEEPAGGQNVEVQPQAKEAPIASGEGYIHEEKMAETMAHAGDKFRTEASSYKANAEEADVNGDEIGKDTNTFMAKRMEGFAHVQELGARRDFELENGPSIDTLLEEQEELHKQLESQADELKQTIEKLKGVNQKIADKKSPETQTPQPA